MPDTTTPPGRQPARAISSPSRVREWAHAARITDDPVGDLILDLRGDRGLPFLFKDIDAMRRHLVAQGACLGALEAVPRAWQRYRSWLNRHPWGGNP